MTTIPHLDALPEELILAVLDHINIDDFRTIRGLNTTCRRLHRLTVDRLYRKFPGRAPEQFLRTIALPPPDGTSKFARHVKEVVWHQSYWTHQARRRGLSLGDRHLVADKLRNSGCILNTMDLSMDLPGRFIGFSAEYEVHWWYLEFFLLFTPKVEELIVYDVWQWDDHSYWFESLAANPTHFENLKSIMLHGPLRLENIVPLLTLPSIRNLELTQVIEMRREPGRTFSWTDGRDGYVEQRLAYGSSLERLVLRESDLRFQAVTMIFESLYELKSLTYEHVPNDLTFPGGMPTRIYTTIGEIQHGEDYSLEHLRVRNQCIVAAAEVLSLFYYADFPTASMKPALENLRTLDIGPCDLASFKGTGNTQLDDRQIVACLPSTLETLHIQWAYEPNWQLQLPVFIDFLLVFARTAASSGSNLKRIAVVDWPALAGWFPLPDEVSRLERAFEEVGMQFAVVYEETQGREPLEVLDDVEPEWLWVHKTSLFETYSGILFGQ